jgi:hypothetical protein
MKLKPMTTFDAGVADKCRPGPGRPDHSISKAELLRSLQEGPVRVVPGELLVSIWLDNLRSWLMEQLCSRIPEGYEDEEGFHYGPRPAPSPRG